MLVAFPIYIPYKLVYNFFIQIWQCLWTYYDLPLLGVICHSIPEFRKLKKKIIICLIRDSAGLIVMHHHAATTRGENGKGRVRKRVGQEDAINRYIITGFVFFSLNKTCSNLHHVALNGIGIFAGSNNLICWSINAFLPWIDDEEI